MSDDKVISLTGEPISDATANSKESPTSAVDDMLEGCKGQYRTMIVIGIDSDGGYRLFSSPDVIQQLAVWILTKAIHEIMHQ